MKMANWLRTAGLMGLGLLASGSVARAGGPGDLPGPIDSLSDVQDTGKMLFKLADENNDGQISQKEAVDAGNLLVGGFFFRADANGDGVLSKDEARAARDAFLAQHPMMRIFIEKNQGAVAATPGSPAANAEQMFEALVDTNRDGNLQATEVRQIIQTGVQAAFAAADTDRNGQISQAEFNTAIVTPATAIFKAMDANNDGQISPQEAQAARQAVMQQARQLRVPEPANSARNLINSGANPSSVAPVPGVNPTQAQPR